MIDVSCLTASQTCPRCPGRRVHSVSIATDEWRCMPFAMPFALAEHVRVHDALARLEDPGSALAALKHFQSRTQVTDE
jgi:hypothetical protein